MSVISNRGIKKFPTTTSLADKEGFFVKLNTGGNAVLVTAAADIPVGVIVEAEETTVDVALLGSGATAHVKLSAAATPGARLALGSAGNAAPGATGNMVAQALEAGASGDLIEAQLLTPVTVA